MQPEMHEIRTFGQALELRKLRNQARTFMTRNRKEISILQQLRWWRTSYGHGIWGYLLRTPEIVGYGLVKCEVVGVAGTHQIRSVSQRGGQFSVDTRPWCHWVSGAVHPAFQRLGHGRRIFRFVTDVALEHAFACTGRREVWLEVFRSNTPARKLYESLGYEERARHDNDEGQVVLSMRLKR